MSEQPSKRRDAWDVVDLLVTVASGLVLLWFTVVVKQGAEDIAKAMRKGELVQRLIGDLTPSPDARVRQDLAIIALEIWVAARLRALGRHPADVGSPPYHFTDEEARLVGRYHWFFAETAKARRLGSVLAAIGLTALVLVPWLALKQAFVPAALIGVNVLVAWHGSHAV